MRKHLTFICRKKISFILHIFLQLFFIAKILWTCFRYFGHAWLSTAKVMLLIYWKLSYLSAGKNKLHHPCFSEYWLSAFWPITREPEFCQIWDWWWNINNNISFHFRLFPRKLFKIFNKLKKFKKIILGPIWALFAQIGQKWIFMEKRALPVFKYSNYLPIIY